jgi:NADH-quinone oxidoreductase subunit I
MLGKGLLKGMAVTARNFIGSYFEEDRLTTVQYPEERDALPENSRTFPFLVYDGTPENMRCVACKICEDECPPQCIYIVMDRDENGKPLKRPKVFDIDISVCMQCQICVEVCPFDAIKMDNDYEKSQYGRFNELVEHLPDLLKPNEYYHKVKPTEAAAVDAKLKAAAAKQKAKAAPAAKKEEAKPAEPQPKTEAAPAKAEAPPETTAPAAAPTAAEPWHDPGMPIDERMKLAEGKSFADKLMAAMAQTDCHACGYDCRGYADAIASGAESDLSLCLPGEAETENMLKKLMSGAGK